MIGARRKKRHGFHGAAGGRNQQVDPGFSPDMPAEAGTHMIK
jgi:hypothetical protein